MKRKVAMFDDFSSVCQYFNCETSVNNGYGCNHQEQEETDLDADGKKQGKCYCWSCPLGTEPDEEDWNNPAVDFDGFQLTDFTGCDGKWLMDSDHISVCVEPDAAEAEKTALYNYERRVNRYNPDWDGGTWKHLHNLQISFVEKEAFESAPLPFNTKGDILIPVFMIKNGKEFFVVNREREKREHYDTEHIKMRLTENNGVYFKFYGIHEDPFALIQWVKGKKYAFESSKGSGRKFNDTETLFTDCRNEKGYGEGFWDFGGNIREVSCAFNYRIYDIAMVNLLKEKIQNIHREDSQ